MATIFKLKNSFKVGFALSVCLLLVFGTIAQNKQKKNLLFIMTDQQQYKALSIAGNTILETPNLDRLAEGGAYFKKCIYSLCSLCTRPNIYSYWTYGRKYGHEDQ